MPTTVQFRRGTTSQNNSFTGAAGEISVDTDLNVLRVHDNSTAGGQALVGTTATQTLTNKTLTSPTINTGTVGTALTFNAQADARFADSDSSNWVAFQGPATIASNITWTLPNADGSSGQALVTNGSGTLSWAAAGATISSDTSTNTDFLLYFASSTSGALTAVNQDSGLTYNPSTGKITASAFAGALTGNVTGDVTGNADTATALATARAIQVSGAVTGTSNFDGSAAINIVTTNTADPTITLTGAVTGSGTLTNLGDVSIATTNTADPTITLGGDLTGSVTLTNLGSGTLTATIAANSVALGTDTTGNYVAAGATSGSGISGSVSSDGGTFTVTSNATNSNTGSTIVFRDSSGNFSAGVITATTTAARYADLAERYIADADYESGTVLVFGGEAEVTQTTSKYDRRIAGIVSTDPAFLMNESLEDGVSVGLVGRLPCKVVGEVRKGDLMVSSDTAGHAEAWRDESNPPAGSVIGKALENKTGAGADVIEVVVGRI